MDETSLTAEMDGGMVKCGFNDGDGRQKGESRILTAEMDGEKVKWRILTAEIDG